MADYRDSQKSLEATHTTVAASYERVSTRLQSQYGYSLQAQHLNLEEFASQNGWQLPEPLRFRDGDDENASGVEWELPGLQAMLHAADSGAFTVLIVPDFDRFARTLVKGLVLEEQLRKRGVRVVFQRVPVEDSPEGRLLRNQLYSFAEYEREKFIFRSIMGRQSKARVGKVVGQSVAPLGYQYVYDDRGKAYALEPDPATADTIRWIYQELLTKSCQEVADLLNEQRIPTPRGRLWTGRQTWRVAMNPTYKGTWLFGATGYDQRIAVEDRGGIAVAVPPLVDESTWNRVQDVLTTRKTRRRGRKPKEDDPFLLRGLLTCGHCHGAIATNWIHKHRYYQCLRGKPKLAAQLGKPVCDGKAIRAEPLEAELWERLTETLLDRKYLEQGLDDAQAQYKESGVLRQERLDTIERDIDAARARLDRLTRRMADTEDDEIYQSQLREAKETSELIGKYQREQDEMLAMPTNGLSPEEVQSITTFADEIRLGIEHATPVDKRDIYEALNIQGAVHVDPNGVRLTRNGRFRIEWKAAIPLRNNMTAQTSTVLLFRSPSGDIAVANAGAIA